MRLSKSPELFRPGKKKARAQARARTRLSKQLAWQLERSAPKQATSCGPRLRLVINCDRGDCWNSSGRYCETNLSTRRTELLAGSVLMEHFARYARWSSAAILPADVCC